MTKLIVKPFGWSRRGESCPQSSDKLRGEYGRLNQSLLFIIVRDRFSIRISPVFSDHFLFISKHSLRVGSGSPFRGTSDNV
ncbi:hypothetical protein XNC1_3508 [Xenorhabdus nematophila ATCC 19061]|uniref:Uncharacterized protein n=1 Tax=Xenorhabdus nematophila (strain ATCC 19061 / DSM 3370 / CCUG 14189 / LMG 1036 / NCIMB 9965 / AN6) TaxID=406817 RepID=D3V9J7_XENNA|nr:hypothetical protein XNC1_3508 [Xenorhabdus nematophila ATCC 19061]CEK24372.1 hypothetical protein XNC2_3378 [Xenorhabdus nematophila AN6/1]